jgi:DNA-directed RNA polymerase subunit H (RpoH/RPB5)
MENIPFILEKVKDLLEDRGDDVSEYDINKYDIEDYILSNNDYLYNKTDKTCVVFLFSSEKKKRLMADIKIKDDPKLVISEFISKFYDELPSMSIDNPISFIFIYGMSLTPTDLKAINKFDLELKKVNGLLTVFEDNELYVNPTRHILTPKHRKLTVSEAKKLMTTNMIKSKANMPHILKTDPVSKWLGFRTGDIIEIERFNKNSGVSYFYRSCV